MAIELGKGERVGVGPKGALGRKYVVGLGWDVNESTDSGFDLDASAFLLGPDRKLLSDGYLVFYNNLQAPGGAVVHSGDNRTGAGEGDDETITVDLRMLDASEVVFVVTIHEAQQRKQNFGQIRDAFIRIYDPDTKEEVVRYDLDEDFSIETAVEFGRLYLKDKEWKFHALGQGYKEGLEYFVNKYQR
jgi:tellurium resistance protein TerD